MSDSEGSEERQQSHLFQAAEAGDERWTDELLASGPEFDPNEGEEEGGRLLFTPLSMAAMFNFAHIVQKILAHPKTDPNKHVQEGGTALIMACCSEYSSTDSALTILNDMRTDVNQSNPRDGSTPLSCALESGNWELVGALLAKGADASTCFAPLSEALVRGNAFVARKLVLEENATADELSPLVEAVLRAAPATDIQAAIDAATDVFDLGVNTTMPALYFAIVLGMTTPMLQLLAKAGLKGSDLETVKGICTSAQAGGFIEVSKALLQSGTVERCASLRKTLLGYMSSVAVCDSLKSPADFDALKEVSVHRLEQIMENLERVYAAEACETMGEVGMHLASAKVRLDDPGLMPHPTHMDGVSMASVKYEVHLVQYINMVSHALNKSYVARIKEVLGRFGNEFKVLSDAQQTFQVYKGGTLQVEQTFQVYKGGTLQVELMQAPIKSVQRMRNKLHDADDHLHKALPRPMHNIDTIRVGIVIHDKALMEPVYNAIDTDVGNFVRVKNNLHKEFDPRVSYGYRALLGNLNYSRHGATVQSIFTDHYAEWMRLAEHMGVSDSWNEVLMAVRSLGDQPLNMAAEVQIVYEPYVSQGRKLSHIHYKIVRCNTPSELLRDAKKPHKRMLTPEAVAAVDACASFLD